MKYRIYQGPTKILDFEAADREEALEKALSWSGLSLHQMEEEDEPEDKYSDLCNCGRNPGFHEKQDNCEADSEEAYLAKDGRQP